MKSVVIVEPEIPENTGFIARLAANFDYSLRIVNPEFNLEESRKTASGAQEKLRNARIFETVEEAVEDLDYVVGTKPGRGEKLSGFQPRQNTSIMIGRESSGLSNDELEMCDATVHIDTPGYSSINQSHATGILMHSMSSREEGKGVDNGIKSELHRLIGGSELEELLLQSNPDRELMGKIIGEIRELNQSDSQDF